MPSGLAYPGGIRSGGPKPGQKSAKETASKINKKKKIKKKRRPGRRGGGRQAPGRRRARLVTLPGPVSDAVLAGGEDGEPRRICCLLPLSLRTAAR